MTDLTFLERCLREEIIEMHDIGRYTINPSFMVVIKSMHLASGFTQILIVEDFYHNAEPICMDRQLNEYPFTEKSVIILKIQAI
jgi:hypothetical protein